MKISELIIQLEHIQEEHGDREVINAKAADVTFVSFEILTGCVVVMTEDDGL